MKRLSLYEKIQMSRLLAASIYDEQRAAGKTKEETMEAIKPVTQDLHVMVRNAAFTDIKECITTIWELENQAEAHETTALEIAQKANNCRYHATKIKEALMTRMETHKVTKLNEGDFSATLSKDEKGRNSITFR